MSDSQIELDNTLKGIFEPVGFEVYPFKVEWYNDAVGDRFKFPYSGDTLAYIIISTPSMFDKALKPYIQKQNCVGAKDPVDQCTAHYFSKVKEIYGADGVDAIHDFEMDHMRRPKVLVQTAGHVAGAAYYYQRKDVPDAPWGEDKKIFGVSVHPVYGGWFALRGVLIFKHLQCPDLESRGPPDVVSTRDDRITLLERFNGNWQDWTFRDVIQVQEKYSEEQKLYFATAPTDRNELIKSYLCQEK